MAAKKKPQARKNAPANANRSAQNGKANVASRQANMVRRMEGPSFLEKLAPWLIGFCAFLFLLCLVFSNSTGAIGPVVSMILRGLFSGGAYLLPVLLLNIAIFWNRDGEHGVRGYKAVFSAFFLLFFSAFWGLFAPAEFFVEDHRFAIAFLWDRAQFLHGGGVLGSLLCNALVAIMEHLASGILLGAGLLLCGSFLLGKTPAELFRSGMEKVKEKRLQAKEYRAYVKEHSTDEGELYTESPAEPTASPAPAPGTADVSDLPPVFVPPKAPGAADPSGSDDEEEDVTKLKPQKAKDESLTDTVASVFSKRRDPKVANRLETVEEKEEDAASLDLGKKDDEDPGYSFPPLELLNNDRVRKALSAKDGMSPETRAAAEKLVRTLETFNVRTKLAGVSQGPTVTRYELQPESGVRVRTITGLADDLALSLAAKGVRIEAPIPGRDAVGVEVPNKAVSIVHIRELLDTEEFGSAQSPLYAALGMDVAGKNVYCDLAKMPHLLIAGATGMGKSVCMNSFLISFLYRSKPEDLRLIMIDPKQVEMNVYNGISHLLVPVVTDAKKAAGALNWAVNEMERRYGMLKEMNVRDIAAYNDAIYGDETHEKLPRIVIVIDELADLMVSARDSVEGAIVRLSQKARAAGIHLIIGTQRPSVDVITGLIKANLPSRIAFTVASLQDSRVILDLPGAEKLLGRGDMLYAPVGATKPIRVQGAFVDDHEVESVVAFLKQQSVAQYSEETIRDIEKEAAMCGEKKRGASDFAGENEGEGLVDDLYWQAVDLAVNNGGIATSLLQRRLSVGYARAARLIDLMEERGIVGPHNGSKPRELRITKEEYFELRTGAADSSGAGAESDAD